MQKHFAPFYVIFPLLADNPKMNVRENVGVASAGDTSGPHSCLSQLAGDCEF